MEDVYPVIEGKIHTFNTAVTTFYAPSDNSGVTGMHHEYIQAMSSWRNGPACYNCVLVNAKPDVNGAWGFKVARVFLFFSFLHGGKSIHVHSFNGIPSWVPDPMKIQAVGWLSRIMRMMASPLTLQSSILTVSFTPFISCPSQGPLVLSTGLSQCIPHLIHSSFSTLIDLSTTMPLSPCEVGMLTILNPPPVTPTRT